MAALDYQEAESIAELRAAFTLCDTDGTWNIQRMLQLQHQ